jgi:hypothetical protein
LVALLALSLGVFSFASRVEAQTCPAGRSCFYVPPALAEASGYTGAGWDMVLASPRGTITGTWRAGAGAPNAFTVSPGAPIVVPLSATMGTAAAYDTIETRGIFIDASSAELVVDHRRIAGPWQSSSTIKNSTTGLGTRFRLGGYNLNGTNTADTGYDYASVYAPFGATVTFTAPPGATAPYWNGSAALSFSVTLTAGQTYIARTVPSAVCGREIDAALVTSTDPITVDTGGRGWAGICSVAGGCGDDGADNVLPVTRVGSQYVVHDFLSAAADGEDVVIIADTAGTEVRVNGALVATLAAGGTHRITVTGVTYITTSHPSYVYQNSGFSGCELDIALLPPVVLAPLGLWVTDFNVAAGFSGQVAVVVSTALLATLRLDGLPLVLPTTALVPGRPDLTAVQFNVIAGSHSVRAGADFQLGLVTGNGGGTGLFAYYTPFRIPGCGDGTRAGIEGCDDGDLNDGDGCSSSCQIEIGFMGCTVLTDCVPAGRCDAGTCVARCMTDAGCNDTNACTVDSCGVTGACVNTPIVAGLPGGCTGGDVCTGAPTNLCVDCVTNAQCGGTTPFCNLTTNTCVACTTDTACMDTSECTADTCSSSNTCSNASLPVGTVCSTGVCNGATSCVRCVDNAGGTGTDAGCLALAPICLGGTACQVCSDTTTGGTDLGCSSAAPSCNSVGGVNRCEICEDTATGGGTDLGCGGALPICVNGALGRVCVACNADSQCGDGIACTNDACTAGACVRTPVAPGGTGACTGGDVCTGAPTNMCVDCVSNTQCGGSTPVCNLLTNTCVGCVTSLSCSGSTPVCDPGTNTCVGCVTAVDCADGSECTTDTCTSNTCANTPRAAGTTCVGGVCNASGTCVVCVDDAADLDTDTGCTSASPLCLGGACQPCSDTTAGGVDLGCAADAPACGATLGANSCMTCEDSATGTGIDNGCAAAAPLCTPGALGPVCVGCVTATDCDDSNVCTTEACVLSACEITGVPAGTPLLCADDAVCSGPDDVTPNTCVTCVSDAECADPTAFCDVATHTCGPCTADFGGAGAACPEVSPLCFLTGADVGTCGRCVTNDDCIGNTSGPVCDLVSGACGTACNIDSDCTETQWCPDSRVCAPRVANGEPIPTAGPAGGMCSEPIGARTCLSGVCEEDDDLCGLRNGEDCTDPSVCRSEVCSDDGLCVECDGDEDCEAGEMCDPSGGCFTPDGGMPDAGVDSGRADVGTTDTGTSPDSGLDAGLTTTPGGLSGGALCAASPSRRSQSAGVFAMLALLGVILARKRR